MIELLRWIFQTAWRESANGNDGFELLSLRARISDTVFGAGGRRSSPPP